MPTIHTHEVGFWYTEGGVACIHTKGLGFDMDTGELFERVISDILSHNGVPTANQRTSTILKEVLDNFVNSDEYDSAWEEDITYKLILEKLIEEDVQIRFDVQSREYEAYHQRYTEQPDTPAEMSEEAVLCSD